MAGSATDLLANGFALVVVLVLPLLVAAALGSLIASLLGSLLGLQDQSISMIARTLAVLLALSLLAGALADETVGFGRAAWAQLASAGTSQR